MLIKPVCTRFFAAIAGTSRYFSVVRSMSQVNSEISGIDKTRARLLYQSKKRGILENDIILGGFAEENLAQMNEQQLKSYDELINGEHMEWDLYYYLSGKKTPPKEVSQCTAFQQLKRYVDGKQKIK